MLASPLNFWLFNLHVFLRQLFHGLSTVGCVWLYINGVSLGLILLAMFSFRLGETILMPYAHDLYIAIGWKISMFLGLISMAIYLSLFSLIEYNNLYLILLVIFGIIYDLLYWPARTNLQRNTIEGSNVSKGVGINSAIGVIGSAGGTIMLAAALAYYESVVFIMASVGLILSFIPLAFIKGVKSEEDHDLKKDFNLLHLVTFIKNNNSSILILILTVGIIEEITELIFPLFLNLNNIQLIDVGFIIGAFYVLNAISNILIGRFDYKNNNTLLYISCMAGIAVTATYYFSVIDATWFIVLFSISSTPVLTAVLCKGQNYALKKYGADEGGFMIQFVDNGARILMYPTFYIVVTSGYTNVFSSMMVVMLITSLLVIAVFSLVLESSGSE